jgi:hypothetical protein
MKESLSNHAAFILATIAVVATSLFFIAGCKEDSSPTGPYYAPTYPSIAGHWLGGGGYWDRGEARWENLSWIVDFGRQTDSTCLGNMTQNYTDVASGYRNWTFIWDVKAKVTLSRKVTITDTSGTAVHNGVRTPIDPSALGGYSGVTLSGNGDTLSFSGSSPENEVFTLVRQH